MKRALDLFLVILFFPIWAPLCLFISLLCKVLSGSPIIFKQMRPGLHGKAFIMYKFRTMSNEHDKVFLPDDERITKFGEFLRKTSLDELPEFWNVLKGDMSLVGPRPLLMEYLERYTSEQVRRHEVRPGITGWAQVNGRTAITFAERFKLDVWYVDNRTLWLDIKILLMSVWKIFLCEGVHRIGQPMEIFKGTKEGL